MKITFSSNCNLFCIKRQKWKLFIIRAQTPPPSFLRWPPTRNADWDSWSWTVSRTTCSWRKSSSGTRSASSPRRKRMRKRGRRLMISEVKSCLIVQRLSGKSDNIVESILRRNPGGTIIFLVFLKLFHILGQRFSFLSCYTLVQCFRHANVCRITWGDHWRQPCYRLYFSRVRALRFHPQLRWQGSTWTRSQKISYNF